VAGVTSAPGGVVVLGGGELLLSGVSVAAVLAACRLAVRVARRDGIGVPGVLVELEAAAALGTARMARSGSGTSEYPSGVEGAESLPEDLIGVQEAARMLGTSARAVRARCARGTLSTAQLVGGRWLLDRVEVQDRVDRRAG